MEDPKDEFQPLFDYGNVQPFDPVNLDDEADEDTLKAFPWKKQKVADVESEPKSVEVVQIKDSKDDDDDWLPPPVKVPAHTQNREEDPFLKALRLEKQELLSIARSAQEILLSVDGDFKKDLNNVSGQFTSNCTAEPLPKPSCERTKIIISIQDKDEVKHFRVYMDDKFEKLFKMYAERAKLDIESLVFTIDGEKICPTASPASLEMEDNDIVEVHIKSR